MHCYCYDQFINKQKTEILSITFSDTGVDPSDEREYCREWAEVFGRLRSLQYAAPIMVNVINSIATFVIVKTSSFIKHTTLNEETMETFKKITILQFFNISVVILLINFAVDAAFLNKMSILNGEFDDFSVGWYR